MLYHLHFFQGAYTDVFVTNGDQTVRIETRRGTTVSEGETINFAVPTDCVVFIEGD